jgi:hypothetical protein
MKIIKDLSDMIADELDGAAHYARYAIQHKVDHPELASVLYDISKQEMHHVNLLHDEVVKVIKSYREKHGEPPAAMQAIYDWQHARQIEDAKEVKILQDQYLDKM